MNSSSNTNQANNRVRNLLVAIAAIILTVALFFGIRVQMSGASLNAVASAATPLETALGNEKPTIVEFYADWCTSCQSMAADNMALQKQYGNKVNFVMLNVDNTKWLPEVTKFRVDGIPHFVFLNDDNSVIGNAIGILPHKVMVANLEAAIAGQPLPHNGVSTGKISPLSAPLPADTTAPRSHG